MVGPRWKARDVSELSRVISETCIRTLLWLVGKVALGRKTHGAGRAIEAFAKGRDEDVTSCEDTVEVEQLNLFWRYISGGDCHHFRLYQSEETSSPTPPVILSPRAELSLAQAPFHEGKHHLSLITYHTVVTTPALLLQKRNCHGLIWHPVLHMATRFAVRCACLINSRESLVVRASTTHPWGGRAFLPQ